MFFVFPILFFFFFKKTELKEIMNFFPIKYLKVPVQPSLLPDCRDLSDPAEGADQPASH